MGGQSRGDNMHELKKLSYNWMKTPILSITGLKNEIPRARNSLYLMNLLTIEIYRPPSIIYYRQSGSSST